MENEIYGPKKQSRAQSSVWCGILPKQELCTLAVYHRSECQLATPCFDCIAGIGWQKKTDPNDFFRIH
jgi:hypothetical protein